MVLDDREGFRIHAERELAVEFPVEGTKACVVGDAVVPVLISLDRFAEEATDVAKQADSPRDLRGVGDAIRFRLCPSPFALPALQRLDTGVRRLVEPNAHNSDIVRDDMPPNVDRGIL